VLNVAGPRASEQPEITAAVRRVLGAALRAEALAGIAPSRLQETGGKAEMPETKRTLPPTYFVAFLAAVFVLHFAFPFRSLIPHPARPLGILPILAGLGLNLSADGLFKRHGTTVKPFQESTALVTGGIFRWTRNPMYLGMVLILFGAGWLAGSLTALVPWLTLAILLDRTFIRPEESMLAARFPEEWREYSTRVRRWI
jgi:protein-S-isoprenylcysteine O-methyltransferase Ste14